ncbi:MAG: hypothetical protein DI528_15730 [Shinella sp.]|nr:MAG: hypothetical protein DI528_15730 [Shinella sp.]
MSIQYEKHGKVAVFTIDNPKVNAFTPQMHKQLHDYLLEFQADQSVHAGIMTGAGDRCFSGGDDIKKPYLRESNEATLNAHFWPSTEEDAEYRPGWDREWKRLERNKPIIGAINGHAIGMGFIMVTNCTDLRIAVPEATFGLPEIAYGMGGAGGTSQIVQHLPQAVARWMILTGEPLTAEQALKHDLINEIVPRERLMERTMEVAEKIASHPPIAVRVEMELLRRSFDMNRSDMAAFTQHLYRLQRAAYLSAAGTKAAPLSTESPAK